MTYDFDQIIDRRQTESSKWHHYDSDILPLPVADMDFVSPEPVVQALRERVEHGVFGYGTLMPEFYDVLLAHLKARYNWDVAAEAIVVLPGVIAGFNLACRAIAQPGEGLLLLTPLYPPMLRAPGNIGLQAHRVSLTQQASGHFTIDFDAFEAAIQPHTRVLMLCNPHNPVGRVWQRHELERMAEICLRHNLDICADEIHCDILFDHRVHVPIATLDAAVADRTITLMSPSKTYNLAGLHCAFAIIPNAALRERFITQRLDLVHRMVNILGYTAMLAAYRDGQAWLDQVLRYLQANRDAVEGYVKAHLPGVTMDAPEGTYLAWLDCRRAGIAGNDPHAFFLQQARVALNNGLDFGADGAGFVRLNFACPKARLINALDRMRDALQTLASGD
jgi:cystathionine beta-lyase